MIMVVLMADIMVVAVVMAVRMIAIVIVVMALIVTVIVVMAVIVIVTTIMVVIALMIVVMLLKHGFQVLGKGLFGRAIDFSDGDSAFGSDLRAGLEFWSKQRTLAVSPAELAVQLADRSLDDA